MASYDIIYVSISRLSIHLVPKQNGTSIKAENYFFSFVHSFQHSNQG